MDKHRCALDVRRIAGHEPDVIKVRNELLPEKDREKKYRRCSDSL